MPRTVQSKLPAIKWTTETNTKLFLTIMALYDVKPNYVKVAEMMNTTPSSIRQQMTKLRKQAGELSNATDTSAKTTTLPIEKDPIFAQDNVSTRSTPPPLTPDSSVTRKSTTAGSPTGPVTPTKPASGRFTLPPTPVSMSKAKNTVLGSRVEKKQPVKRISLRRHKAANYRFDDDDDVFAGANAETGSAEAGDTESEDSADSDEDFEEPDIIDVDG